MIYSAFSFPIYHNSVQNVDVIQEEMSKCYNQCVAENRFAIKPEWNSHRISDITFGTNIIDEFKLEAFKTALFNHVVQYLVEIRSPMVHKISQGPALYKITNSWLTETLTGQYAHVHTHGTSDISGTYYFKTNGQDGRIFFNPPTRILGTSPVFEPLDEHVAVDPEVGKIVLFPSSLEHGVETNTTDNVRVSLSFNLDF